MGIINTIVLVLSVAKAQKLLKEQLKTRRLELGFTQEALAQRSGVSLASLRKFEQKGLISLESFLKLTMVLACLQDFVCALEQEDQKFHSIDDVLKDASKKIRKHGWRK